MIVNYNGKISDESEVRIPLDNRSFRFGDGLFETLRVINGKVKYPELHFERMRSSMGKIKLDIPEEYNPGWFENQLNDLISESGLNNAKIRMTVFRDGKGLYTPETNKPAYLITINEIPLDGYILNKTGLTVDIFDGYKKTIDLLSNIKSCNAIPYVLAGIFKKQAGLDDAILLNDLGNLVECISSNIFIVYNGVYYTPSLSQGCVDGVMRKVIINYLKKNNMEVQECPLGPNALLRADEVFLTNAISGVRWVSGYKMKRYFHKHSDQVISWLNMEL